MKINFSFPIFVIYIHIKLNLETCISLYVNYNIDSVKEKIFKLCIQKIEEKTIVWIVPVPIETHAQYMILNYSHF